MGLQAQQVYHNNRSETWVDFSDGAHPTDRETKNSLRVGFDQAGQMIHADPRPWQPDPVLAPFPMPESSEEVRP